MANSLQSPGRDDSAQFQDQAPDNAWGEWKTWNDGNAERWDTSEPTKQGAWQDGQWKCENAREGVWEEWECQASLLSRPRCESARMADGPQFSHASKHHNIESWRFRHSKHVHRGEWLFDIMWAGLLWGPIQFKPPSKFKFNITRLSQWSCVRLPIQQLLYMLMRLHIREIIPTRSCRQIFNGALLHQMARHRHV